MHETCTKYAYAPLHHQNTSANINDCRMKDHHVDRGSTWQIDVATEDEVLESSRFSSFPVDILLADDQAILPLYVTRFATCLRSYFVAKE